MTHPGERIQINVKVVPRRCIADPQLRLFQYTAIDEYSRYRVLGAYPEQSMYSSADFLKKVERAFAAKGVHIECVQTGNGFEFTNRFLGGKETKLTLFEAAAASLGIRHKLIRPYTPRHNGKVERSHREDQKLSTTRTVSTRSPTLVGSELPTKVAPITVRCVLSARQLQKFLLAFPV